MYPGVHASTHPGKPAVIAARTGESLSYAELEERSVRLANLLRDAGLRPGDHLALLSDNDPRCLEVYWAAMRSGLYLTAVNSHLTTDETAYVVQDCGATVLIVSETLADLAAALVPRTPGVKLRLAYGHSDARGHADRPTPPDGYASYEKALAGASPVAPARQPRGADMLYSSGTTGRPKGIQPALSGEDITEGPAIFTAIFAPLYGFDTSTVYLSPAPLYHAAPLRFCGVITATGGTAVLMDSFDAEECLALIERYGVTHGQWVPTMFVRMLKLPEKTRQRYDLTSLRVAIHAAAPCPTEVKHRMLEWWGPVLHEYYSSTEGNGLTVITPQEWLRKPGSVGRSGLLGDLRVCDEEGAVLPPGTTGTVYFARDEPPFAYHNDPEHTAEARHPEHPNWTTTGDIGHVDEDGYLFLTDRKAFTIISGGVNIYPQEIENCLALHPRVADVAVVGVHDAEMGESVRAVVRPEPDSVPGPELERELLAYVRERMAHHKVPRAVEFTDTLPRTPTGKLAKGALRERLNRAALEAEREAARKAAPEAEEAV
ncbi:acyl-CoA synthetase [Streptomyces iconiensis]|uniref:Acyl-CoA synthetase n=1 Tax=Streptomyces iconiensis TaxID=1384038 RepID=A0ABT6ZQC5_9ACTN|nr:acyl-CoA synthetase [Streptomyces iconiensis]MDJ1131052.1 acyl-CoA synthetase [Streptomyces iconiensis]